LHESKIVGLFRQNQILHTEWEQFRFHFAEWLLERARRNADEAWGRRSHVEPHSYVRTCDGTGLSGTSAGHQVSRAIVISSSAVYRSRCISPAPGCKPKPTRPVIN
jgi:hypothetical protein